MAKTGLTFTADKRLRRNLDRLAGKEVARIAQRSGIDAYGKPLVQEARRQVPVRSGKLRASLGYQANRQSRKGRVLITVGPRKKFNFANTSGDGAVAVAGKSKRARAARETAKASGRRINSVPAHVYAIGIEFGRHKNGRIARKKPALFMSRAFALTSGRVPPELVKHLQNNIASIIT